MITCPHCGADNIEGVEVISGALFSATTGATSISKAWVAKSPGGSLARTTTETVPTWAGVGVHVTSPVDASIAIPAGAMSSE